MTAEHWNLLAAILCTISSVLVTVAALLSDLSLVGVLTVIAGLFAALGGAAWIKSAIDALRRR